MTIRMNILKVTIDITFCSVVPGNILTKSLLTRIRWPDEVNVEMPVAMLLQVRSEG